VSTEKACVIHYWTIVTYTTKNKQS